MIKSESLSKLAPALVKAQKKMGAALKDSKNPFFKSKYADLNAIIDAAIPTLNDEGIAVVQPPDVLEINGQSVIETMLLHESGEYLISRTKVVAAKANDPQAEGSATTYARRYGLQAMVTLKAEDDDGELAMGRNKPKVVATTSITPPVETVITKTPAVSAAPEGARKVSFARKSAAPVVTKPVDNGDDI